MKKTLSVFLAILCLISVLAIPASASEAATPLSEGNGYYLVDDDTFIPVTKEQFDAFNEQTDLAEFMDQYDLVAEPAEVIEMDDANAEHVNMNATRASIGMSAHSINSSGTYYYTSSGGWISMPKNGTFTIKLNFELDKKKTTWIGYNNGTLSYGRTAVGYFHTESFKFTEAKTIRGVAQAGVGEVVKVTSGSMHW